MLIEFSIVPIGSGSSLGDRPGIDLGADAERVRSFAAYYYAAKTQATVKLLRVIDNLLKRREY